MKQISALFILAGSLLLSGCAHMFGAPPAVGDTEAQAISKRGQPSAVYRDGSDKLLSYAPGYWGQQSFMARIGPDGRVKSYDQVWTSNEFALIKPEVSTREDVLRIVGAPSFTSTYGRVPYTGWNYGYKEAGAWDSLMTIYIDKNGLVRGMENGLDPRYESSDSSPGSK